MGRPDSLIALDRVLSVSRVALTGAEAAEQAGVDAQWAGSLWRAAGFEGRFEDRQLSHEDVRLLEAAARLTREGAFTEAEVLQFARMFNLATAPLADAAAGVVNRLTADRDAGFERLVGLDKSLAQFEEILLHTWRRRFVRVVTSGCVTERHDEAVAFVDLVGFTGLVGRGDGWLDVLDRLEAVVFDIVAGRDGRVVKTIGDEVMWVHHEPEEMIRTCAAISTAVASDPLLASVRIGAAWGELVSTRGDRFGTPVNLASRLVRRCRPGEVLLDEHLAETADVRARHRWIKGLGWVRTGRLRTEPGRHGRNDRPGQFAS